MLLQGCNILGSVLNGSVLCPISQQSMGFPRGYPVDQEELELVHIEDLKSIPQWVLLIGLNDYVWNKEAVVTITNNLSVRLEVRYLKTEWDQSLPVHNGELAIFTPC